MRLKKNSLFIFGSNVLQLVAALASGSVIARMLGPGGKGETYLAIQTSTIVSLLFSLGLGPSYLYHLSKGLVPKREVIWHTLFLLLSVSTFLGLLLVFGEESLSHLLGVSQSVIRLTVALSVVNVAVLLTTSILMAAHDGVAQSSVFSVIGSVIYVVLLLFFMGWLQLGVVGVLIVTLVGICARLGITIYVITKDTARRPIFPAGKVHSMLFTYGFGSLLCNVTLTGVLRIDTFLVNGYLGAESLGLYSVAVGVGELLLMLPSSIGIALFPQLSSTHDDDQIHMMCRVARMSALIGVIGVVVVAAGGRILIAVIFGTRFSGAYQPLLWLLPGLLAMTVNYSYANYFSSRGRPYSNAILFGGGAVINVIANMVLIPRFGVRGASMASTISYILTMIGFVILIKRTQEIAWSALLFPGRTEIKSLLQHF